LGSKAISLKFPLFTVVFNVIIIALYAILVSPPVVNGVGFIILFVPPLLGVAGFVSAILAFFKTNQRKKYCAFLIFLNLIFVCWWPVMHVGIGLINMWLS